MTVTEIEEISKKQSRVKTDQDISFVLYKGELRRFGIARGEELAEDARREILEVLLPRRAKLRAMNLLQARDYTERQLRDKLLAGGYPQEAIGQAIAYVKSYHYIDDLRYARAYLSTFAGRKSLLRMEQELRQRGVPRDVAAQAIDAWRAEDGGQDELQMACALLEKKHYDREAADCRQQRRLYSFLLGRGFSPDTAREALHRSACTGVPLK